MKKLAHPLAVGGAMLQLAIPVGLVIFIVRALAATSKISFGNVSDVNQIVANINEVTRELGAAYDPFFVAFGVAMLGVIPFLVSVLKLGYRRKWAFWFSCVYGGFLLLMFPVGTVLGLVMLVYALRHKREFGVGHVLVLSTQHEATKPTR